MRYFICKQCEQKYPKREENTMGNRKILRKHLRKAHNAKNNLTKKGDDKTPALYKIIEVK